MVATDGLVPPDGKTNSSTEPDHIILTELSAQPAIAAITSRPTSSSSLTLTFQPSVLLSKGQSVSDYRNFGERAQRLRTNGANHALCTETLEPRYLRRLWFCSSSRDGIPPHCCNLPRRDRIKASLRPASPRQTGEWSRQRLPRRHHTWLVDRCNPIHRRCPSARHREPSGFGPAILAARESTSVSSA